jgi:hypothetical protein
MLCSNTIIHFYLGVSNNSKVCKLPFVLTLTVILRNVIHMTWCLYVLWRRNMFNMNNVGHLSSMLLSRINLIMSTDLKTESRRRSMLVTRLHTKYQLFKIYWNMNSFHNSLMCIAKQAPEAPVYLWRKN